MAQRYLQGGFENTSNMKNASRISLWKDENETDADEVEALDEIFILKLLYCLLNLVKLQNLSL